MSDRVVSGSADRVPESIGRGIATIVVAGIVLGLGFNQLGRASRPPRGLPWVAEAKVLPKLEDALGAAAAPTPSAAADSDDPLGGGALVDPSDAGGLPVIPDLDRPLSVEREIVRKFVDAKAALLIDAREPEEFEAGRIPGSINFPYDTAGHDPARLEQLDSGGRPIIIYCGGGTCEVSMQLAETLIYQHAKRRVLVYTGGWPDWAAAGLPVER